MVKNSLIAFFGGGLMWYLGKDLGSAGIAIGIFSAGALIAAPYCKKYFAGKTVNTILFLFLILFEIGGFTIAAYPSAARAVEFYGDFHDAAIYQGVTTAPLIRTAPMLVLPAEARFAAFFIKGENAEGEILILIGLISRVIALIALLILGKEITGSAGTALLGAYAFVFSYRLVPFTQGMKFVAGMPFILLWLLFTARQENGKKNIPFLQEGFFAAALFSEQWIASFAVAVFFSHSLFKAVTEKRFFSSESRIGIFIAALAGIWHSMEYLRFRNDKPFFMNTFPQIALPDTIYGVPLFIASVSALALLFGVFVWRRSREKNPENKKGYYTLTLVMAPLAVAAACGILEAGSASAYFSSHRPMLLASTLMGLLATPSAPPILLAGLLAAGAHYILVYGGILIVSSPYLSSIAAPFAIFALRPKKAFFIATGAFVVATGALFLWQFTSYIPENTDIAYSYGAILALTAITYMAMRDKKTYAA